MLIAILSESILLLFLGELFVSFLYFVITLILGFLTLLLTKYKSTILNYSRKHKTTLLSALVLLLLGILILLSGLDDNGLKVGIAFTFIGTAFTITFIDFIIHFEKVQSAFLLNEQIKAEFTEALVDLGFECFSSFYEVTIPTSFFNYRTKEERKKDQNPSLNEVADMYDEDQIERFQQARIDLLSELEKISITKNSMSNDQQLVLITEGTTGFPEFLKELSDKYSSFLSLEAYAQLIKLRSTLKIFSWALDKAEKLEDKHSWLYSIPGRMEEERDKLILARFHKFPKKTYSALENLLNSLICLLQLINEDRLTIG